MVIFLDKESKILEIKVLLNNNQSSKPETKNTLGFQDINSLIIKCLRSDTPESVWSFINIRHLSDFQLKVYKELIKIPYGTSCSYKDLAVKIKNPSAARAVGNALSKNPFPIIIPCHRVIRSNGCTGRFSQGDQIKKKLLSQEKSRGRS
ncbi:MAG: MGMT family protein [bacterium]|nr:MGMT family protein [bacterium]